MFSYRIRSVSLILALLVICFSSGTVYSQALEENLIKDLKWRNIGPANTSGRISDIEALDNDFTHVIVASASGGVWKSLNAGTSWEPIFDDYGTASIGDIALFQPNPDIIWVGTGEECCRNTATWGDGIYKSTDGGQTFVNMGLQDVYTIGTVLTHPTNPDIVYAAAAGCVWAHDIGDRGFFKTTNGGLTWTKLTNGLPDDGKTGAIEAVMHPTNPDIIYVSFWERLRRPWRFDSGGPDGGIFKTTDGGRSWKKLIKGLPEGDSGKIGLAISKSNPDVLMAFYEHGFQPARTITNAQGERSENPDFDDMTKLGTGIYRSEDGGGSWTLMNRYQNRPFYYSHIWINPFDDKLVYVLAGNFQYSEDGGKRLQRFTGRNIHSDYHALWLDPANRDRFYVGNDGGAYLTHDHGDNFIMFKNFAISQVYMLGVDMRDPYYVYGGLQDNCNWGGPSATRDDGIYTDLWYMICFGDGFHNQVDPTDWRIVYTEPHPGNTGGRVQRINVETRESKSIRPQKGENIINYDEYITPEIEQLQLEKGWGTSPGNGSGAFRWNWSSPLILSPHDPHTIFLGANHLFKSVDRGDTWYLISPDLTKNEYQKTIKESGGLTPDHDPGGGAEFHGTLITISESPIKQGVIWAGTDDGNVQVTQNGGTSWENVSENISGLPAPDLWVSRVEASHFDVGTCYLTIDGHRSANFDPWVFKTTDFGATWTNITSNLPGGESVYVIREDLKNPNLLFIGTEFSAFYSITGGRSWAKLNKNLPTVAIHDLVIHPRDNDLLAGTHGRSIWIMDDITPLQQATPDVLASGAYLFKNRTATQWLSIRTGDTTFGRGGSLYFEGENPTRNAVINYYIGRNTSGEITLEISDLAKTNKRVYTLPAEPGIGRLEWDMRFAAPDETAFGAGQQRGGGGRGGRARGPMAEPGTYVVTLTANGETYTGTITIREDPLLSTNK
ncbi:WD40/YVTN/BNR-like repeat-containing protein [candidate division KSB1 bacterium]